MKTKKFSMHKSKAVLLILGLLLNGCRNNPIDPGDPKLSVFPNSLDFGGTETSLSINITNSGSGTLDWSTGDDQNWITVIPPIGNTTAETDVVKVTVTRDGIAPGIHSGTVRVSSNRGEETISVTMQVKPGSSQPVAKFSAAPTRGKTPLNVKFFDESTGNIHAWAWDFGDGATSNLQSPSHDYIAPGLYSVSLRVSGPDGADTKTQNGYITVFDKPVADFDADKRTGDAPLTINFTNKSVGEISSWQWDFGNGRSSTAQHPSQTYTKAGIYTVRLTVLGPGGSDSEEKINYIAVDEIMEFTPGNIPDIGPKWPSHTRGDREFNGHGPIVTATASLFEGPFDQAVTIRLTMKAEETRYDFTTAEGKWDETVLLPIPPDLKVKKVLSPSEKRYTYTDTNHDYDLSPLEPLGVFRIMGDTQNEDVGNTTLDDTHIYFEKIHFRVRVGPK